MMSYGSWKKRILRINLLLTSALKFQYPELKPYLASLTSIFSFKVKQCTKINITDIFWKAAYYTDKRKLNGLLFSPLFGDGHVKGDLLAR